MGVPTGLGEGVAVASGTGRLSHPIMATQTAERRRKLFMVSREFDE